MASLEELKGRRDALRALRGRGVKEVQYSNGSRVVYRDDDELEAALADLERQIASGGGRPLREVRLSTSKGF